MWNDYFVKIQHKYTMRISTKNPTIIRFDGQNITKDSNINFLNYYDGSFSDSLEKTVQYFSEKYNCLAIFGSDEASFIIETPNVLIEEFGSNKANEIIALFSQHFYEYFNHFDTHRKVFWHGKCFSIPAGKINSYIKYRSGKIKTVMPVYFLKKKNVKHSGMKLSDMIKKCKEFSDYNSLKKILYGTLYFKGEKIDVLEFLDGNIVKLDEIREEDIMIDFNFLL